MGSRRDESHITNSCTPVQCTSLNRRPKAGSHVRTQHCQQQMKLSPKRMMTSTSEYLHHIHALRDSAEVKKLFKIANICLIYCCNTHLIYCYDTQSDLLLQYTISFTVTIHNLAFRADSMGNQHGICDNWFSRRKGRLVLFHGPTQQTALAKTNTVKK